MYFYKNLHEYPWNSNECLSTGKCDSDKNIMKHNIIKCENYYERPYHL